MSVQLEEVQAKSEATPIKFSQETSEKLYTVEEFLKLDLPGDENDDDSIQYELIGGRIVAKPKSGTSGEHGEIANTVGHYLKAYADIKIGEKKLGRIYNQASCNLGQPENLNYVEPDVCFVLAGRTPDKFRGAIPVAPDLVVEVWSPTDTTEKIHNKLEAYRQTGVRLIWSIYMLDKYILVHHLDQPKPIVVGLEDELDGSEVIPGFKLAVKALFE